MPDFIRLSVKELITEKKIFFKDYQNIFGGIIIINKGDQTIGKNRRNLDIITKK